MKKLNSMPEEFWRSIGLNKKEARVMSSLKSKKFHIIDDKLKKEK
jgi:hypothetical protein